VQAGPCRSGDAGPAPVWVERDPFIDRVPRPVAMAFVLFVILGIWWGLTASGLVSAIVLPTPMIFRGEGAFELFRNCRVCYDYGQNPAIPDTR